MTGLAIPEWRDHSDYPDDYIRAILSRVRTIAMVGVSPDWTRPSNFAMKYLQTKGYTVYPVNPATKATSILGERVYASLADLPVTVDMVDIFRNSAAAGPVTEDAIAHRTRVVWMQLGVSNPDAARQAEANGIHVVMNRCPKIEYSRLHRELSWHGINSGVISSRRRTATETVDATNVDRKPGFDTRAIHAGATPDPVTGARSTPIFQTTAYVFDDADHAASLFNLQTFGNIYARLSNPTTAVLEERLASLEGGRGTTCTASGHAAQMVALLPLMDSGDRLVASTRLYGGSITQFGKTFRKFGWHCTFVDTDDVAAVEEAVNHPRCKALFVESIANPGGVVTDIVAMKTIARTVGIPLIVDNTMATPWLCQPIEHGADIVVHSTTKFLSGHGNAMGGAVVDSGHFDWLRNDR
ncbi:MAG: aminotransferase class I/II-fold pyridoxal phosphate-dependent enzyme, partial [Rhodobacteraceae bacterium]|nr:aminotransferase class I/II-fold pyridoxal phosphate-dependent enzyme [Paracoccaceae bacterium]